MEPFSFYAGRMHLMYEKVITKKWAVCVNTSITQFFDNSLSDASLFTTLTINGEDAIVRYYTGQSIDIQNRFFLGAGQPGKGFFIAPYLFAQRGHVTGIISRGGSTDYGFGQISTLGAGTVFGYEYVEPRGGLLSIYMGSGVNKFGKDESTSNIRDFFVPRLLNVPFKFGFSVGVASHDEKFIPSLDTFTAYDRRMDRNALTVDPIAAILHGLAITYQRATGLNRSLVFKAGFYNNPKNNDVEPIHINALKWYSGGVAVRQSFGDRSFTGTYVSIGYNYNHFDYRDEQFIRRPFPLRNTRVSRPRSEDLHEVEWIFGVQGGGDFLYFDLGIKQGLRFANRQRNSNLNTYIFQKGVYTFINTGLGIRF